MQRHKTLHDVINESGENIDVESIFRMPEYTKLRNLGFIFRFRFKQRESRYGFEVKLPWSAVTRFRGDVFRDVKGHPNESFLVDYSVLKDGEIERFMYTTKDGSLRSVESIDHIMSGNHLLNLSYIQTALTKIYEDVSLLIIKLEFRGVQMNTSKDEVLDKKRINRHTADQIKDLW